MAAFSSNALERMLTPLADCLTPESAQRLLEFQLDPETRSRIDDLADRASEGQLTEEERSEYRDYVEAIDLIGILQTQARQVLLRRTGT